ncbi:MAG TPA: EAL domain-containing protein [Gemmatimonadales bacterium]|nr:EAL domain-containing protein [Gemmatimonadales bacterium]
MVLRSGPLRSRFGRRLLALFVGCALVPIGILAALSFRHMTRQLEAQSERRLLESDEALARAIFERLLLLESTLRNVPPRAVAELVDPPRTPRAPRYEPARRPVHIAGNRTQGARADGRIALGGIAMRRAEAAPRRVKPAPPAQDPETAHLLAAGIDLLARRRFTALEWWGPKGRHTAIFGRLTAIPALDDADSADVLAGGTLLRTGRGEHGAHVYMLRALDRAGGPPGFFVGEISPEYLWGTHEESMPSPGTAMAVVNDAGTVLTGFAPRPTSTASRDGIVVDTLTRGAFASTIGGRPYLSVHWPIVLQKTFAAQNWTLVLSESQAAVMEPMTDFQPTFLLIVAFCTLAVLLLSVSQIRRSLVPLERLQEGTRRIALRDFESRVEVSSRDEFAELADSFNGMAMRLGRQFQALATAAEIDRTVLAATDSTAVVDALLARIGDVYPCRAASVTLISPDRAEPPVSRVQVCGSDARQYPVPVALGGAELRQLATGPEILELNAGEDRPALLAPIADAGAESFVILPLRYQRQLAGVLALGGAPGLECTPDDLLQARRLADQVAVALANAGMIEQVRTLAYFDCLTGLLNRSSYTARVDAAIADAKRTRRQLAVYFVDLDGFGRINDTLGHEAGDELLRQVAARLRASRADEETAAVLSAGAPSIDVARLGGDEFAVVLAGLDEADQAIAFARRTLAALAPPFRLGAHEIFMTASVGVAFHPGDGEDAAMLLAHADTAMYQAKGQGGNGYQLYARSMNAAALHRLTLEGDLRRALEGDELELHYQPIVDATSGGLAGAEALVRWRHPSLGLLLPGEFVPLAEETGLICPLGEWVLRAACAQHRAWQQAGLPPIRVVVNLASRQLRQGTLVATVREVLAETGIASRHLGLELTESALMDREHETLSALHALRAMGVQLSIDDFGTGYSSLSYLKHFPVDALKIDRAFVRDLVTRPKDAAITAAIIAMAHALELKVVAEGVETDAHLAFLRRLGCDEIQGHLVGRAMPADKLAERLASGPVVGRSARRARKVGTLGR